MRRVSRGDGATYKSSDPGSSHTCPWAHTPSSQWQASCSLYTSASFSHLFPSLHSYSQALLCVDSVDIDAILLFVVKALGGLSIRDVDVFVLPIAACDAITDAEARIVDVEETEEEEEEESNLALLASDLITISTPKQRMFRSEPGVRGHCPK